MKKTFLNILPTLVVIAIGFIILYPLEKYLEGYLALYIQSDLLVTLILLIIAFGPVFYFEEKIENYIEKKLNARSSKS